jgi:hypothetical protein
MLVRVNESMYRDSCAREGFKADLRHPDVSITEQAYVYGMNDTVWNRYGYVTTCDYDITVQYYLYRYRTNT